MPSINELVSTVIEKIREMDSFDGNSKRKALNKIKRAMHAISPFKGEPVDCVLWIPFKRVVANDYNPNSVAPPEMKLLEHSISSDGYTQPIVTWEAESNLEVIDGFHRHRVGRECLSVKKRIHGCLPVTIIKSDRTERNDRIAATIRHNRARGKHQVEAMSDIVIELKRRNWSDERIGRELGMDPDEVLRLTQISGLAELFQNQEFSKSWDLDTALNQTLSKNPFLKTKVETPDETNLPHMGQMEMLPSGLL